MGVGASSLVVTPPQEEQTGGTTLEVKWGLEQMFESSPDSPHMGLEITCTFFKNICGKTPSSCLVLPPWIERTGLRRAVETRPSAEASKRTKLSTVVDSLAGFPGSPLARRDDKSPPINPHKRRPSYKKKIFISCTRIFFFFVIFSF